MNHRYISSFLIMFLSFGSQFRIGGQEEELSSKVYHYHSQLSYMGQYSKYKFYNHLFYNPAKRFDVGVRLTPVILGKSDNFPVICGDAASGCKGSFQNYYGTGYGLFFHYNLGRFRLEALPYIDYYFSHAIPDAGFDFNVYYKFSNNVMLQLGVGIVSSAYLSDKSETSYFNAGVGYNFSSEKRSVKIAHNSLSIAFAIETLIETLVNIGNL